MLKLVATLTVVTLFVSPNGFARVAALEQDVVEILQESKVRSRLNELALAPAGARQAEGRFKFQAIKYVARSFNCIEGSGVTTTVYHLRYADYFTQDDAVLVVSTKRVSKSCGLPELMVEASVQIESARIEKVNRKIDKGSWSSGGR